jgi:hypothetical protein
MAIRGKHVTSEPMTGGRSRRRRKREGQKQVMKMESRRRHKNNIAGARGGRDR